MSKLHARASRSTALLALLGASQVATAALFAVNDDEAPVLNKRYFYMTITTLEHTPEGDAVVIGTVTVKGKVYRKKRVVGDWSADTVAQDCIDRTSGNFRMRYKFLSYATAAGRQ